MAGDIELRSKRELIQKFIDSNLPKLGSSAEIPDIVELIQKPLGILERGPTRKRVLDKVVDYVATFIRGVAA